MPPTPHTCLRAPHMRPRTFEPACRTPQARGAELAKVEGEEDLGTAQAKQQSVELELAAMRRELAALQRRARPLPRSLPRAFCGVPLEAWGRSGVGICVLNQQTKCHLGSYRDRLARVRLFARNTVSAAVNDV